MFRLFLFLIALSSIKYQQKGRTNGERGKMSEPSASAGLISHLALEKQVT